MPIKKAIKHRLEYAAVRLVDAWLHSMPRSKSLAVGEKIGLAMSRVLTKRDALIKENLRHAFPLKSSSDIDRIARAVWTNLGRTAVEFVRMDDLAGDKIFEYVTFEGREHPERDQATGGIYLTMHFTNWELTGVATQAFVKRLLAIARPMKNPLVESWIQSKRRSTGMEIILHRQAVRASLRALREKRIIGILADQNLYTGGVFVNFFGRPAATTTLPALLHSRTNCPVVLSYSLREGEKFRIVYRPLTLPPIEDPEERIIAHTQLISNAMEDVIRRYPENWFWIHNRWKRRPDPAQPPAVDTAAETA